MPERHVDQLARKQLDQRLGQIREETALSHRPEGGWIATLRRSLRMPQAYLAQQMGITRQAVSQLEKREADGSITLGALEQAAQALGGRLVYAVIPDRPLDRILSDRALELADQMTKTVRHTMRLEDQEPASDLRERTQQLAAELLERPTRLWASNDGQ